MPRGRVLNEEEKAKIVAYKDMGLSNRQIAKKIKRSHHAVNNFINLSENYNKNHPKGGNKKITRRQHSSILRLASSGVPTARQIRTELELPVTTRRVQQILSKSGRFRWKKMITKPPLTEKHKSARLKFAKDHMTWDAEWENVIFSDEKKFNLDGPDGFKYYWHDLTKKDSIAMSRNFGGGTVMVWAAFCFHGKTPICFITAKMNARNYEDLLEDILIEFSEGLPTENWIFQQDNAAIHTARSVKQWFQEKNIRVLDWPARSPDLNPIENLWGILARTVYGNSRQYNTIQELKTSIQQAWNDISKVCLENLIKSMKKRIFELISVKGGSTHY